MLFKNLHIYDIHKHFWMFFCRISMFEDFIYYKIESSICLGCGEVVFSEPGRDLSVHKQDFCSEGILQC